MSYKLASLILAPPQKANYISEVFISQPDAAKEALAGKLFALIEIHSKKASDIKIINFLVNTLNYDYYQNEKMILRERLDSIKIEHIFESALAKTNKKLAEFLHSEKIKFNPSLANITVGVVYKDSLHFSSLGKNKALLIFKQKAATKYKLADISEKTTTASAKTQSLNKLFSNVLSGSLPPAGYFVICNETLSEYLSTKQLIDIITKLPPAGAVEQIKNLLLTINAYIPFLAIIIKNQAGAESAEIKKIPEQLATSLSIDNLNKTEAATEKLLTPAGVLKTKTWLSPLLSLASGFNFKSFNQGSQKMFLLKDKIFLKKRPAWLTAKKLINTLKIIIYYSINFFIFAYKTITNKEKLKELAKSIIAGLRAGYVAVVRTIFRIIFWYKKLNKKNKILLGIALICLLFFAQNLIWLTLKNKQVKTQDNYNQAVSALEQKQNQIDASLLYGNEAGAKTLLAEVKILLDQLPRRTSGQKELLDKLSAKNSVQLEKITHVIKIEAPVELANFSNLNATAQPLNIILANGKIYAADSQLKSIYSLDLNNQLITAIADLGKPISQLLYPAKFSAKGGDDKIYYFNLNNIMEFDAKTESIALLNIESNFNLNNTVDIKGFNGRLYFLDAKNNKITRLNKSGSEFANAYSWLAEDADLTSSVSLDIDGSIYVLKNNGEVLKFTKGKIDTFSLQAIEPVISSATKILVSPEQKYIYILEPANKRLVIFDKSGKFLNQYLINGFNDLKDFTVDETSKKIYFLNGTSVYVIDGQHFDK